MSSLHRNFSHIYIEDSAREHPNTIRLLERFPKSEVIPIRNYKEVFNRNQQNFSLQKKSQNLIIAKRNSEFLYTGSSVVPSFGHQVVHYNTLVLNCLYDCEYCYLQGMFPSSHLVVFVNNNDFIEAAKSYLKENSSMYLCLSYDTDLLALEHLLGYCREWIEFSREHPSLTIEIRTKSAAIGTIEDTPAHPGAILAWTLSPSSIAKQYEHGTPSTTARINSIAKAIELGWKVRICVDPILSVKNWEEEYRELIDLLFQKVSPEQVTELSLGSFRMGEQYIKRMKKVRPHSLLVHQDLESTDGIHGLPRETEQKVLFTVASYAKNYLSNENIDVLSSQTS